MGEGVQRDRGTERDNVSLVCRHLALVAIDGACGEVVDTLEPEMRMHLDGCVTDLAGYLALIDANHAAHPDRPPLDVLAATCVGDMVRVRIEPRCLVHMRLDTGRIAEIWMTVDWDAWRTTLLAG